MYLFLIRHLLYVWMTWPSYCGGIPAATQHGVVTFESEQVASLYEHFDIGNETPIDTLRVSSRDASLIVLYSAPPDVPGALAVEMKNQRHVQHVGLHLFSAEEAVVFEPVGRFIERYLLQVYAEAVLPEMSLSLLQSQRVGIRINGYSLGDAEGVVNDVRVLSQYLLKERSCSLDWRAYTYMLVCETDDYDLIEVEVPAQAELILGLDKKELQAGLTEEMKQQTRVAKPVSLCTTVPASSSLDPHRKGIIRTQGRVLHPGIRSEIYYQQERKGRKIELLRDPSDWLEYLNNVIICPPEDLSTRVRVTHKMYGFGSSSWEMPLYTVLAYFDPSGFDTYAGFEQDDKREITGTAVFKHKTLDYNHLLVIHNLDALVLNNKATQVLDAELYTFIRNDNVASLYGDYMDRLGEKIPVSIDP